MSILFIYIAVSYVTICLLQNYKQRVVLALLWGFIFHKNIVKKQRIFAYGSLVLLLVCSIPLTGTHFYSGRVNSVKDNYYIVADGISQVILYTETELALDDYVVIDEDISAITSYNNFEVSSFTSWAKGNNIIGTIDKDTVEIIKPSSSLRGKLFKHNEETGNNWANELLFGTGLENDSDYSYLFIQSGMHISFLAALILQLVSFFLYEKQAYPLTILILTAIASFFNFPYGFIRVIIFYTCRYFFKDKREEVAVETILLVLYKPYYVVSISFLVPVGLKVISTYGRWFHPLTNRLYLIVIQLIFYGQCNLLAMLLFGLSRKIAGIFYCLSLFSGLLSFYIPLDEIMNYLLGLMDKVPIVSISHRPNFILIILFLYLLERFMATDLRRYQIGFVILLVFNQFYACFIPYYTITQLDVGQGDCCVITLPFSDEAILIDTGGSIYKDIGNDIVLPYLYSQGIHKVSIIISHDDYDHSGALTTIEEGIQVLQVYTEKQQLIQIKDLKIYNPLYQYEYEDDNDNSLICYFNLGDFYFLYLGDVSASVESDLVDLYPDLEVTVTKISHHGSASATSEKLLTNYRFPYALISAGKNNYYGHPAASVVERLDGYRITSLSTQTSGAIRFYVYRYFMIYIQADGGAGIYFN